MKKDLSFTGLLKKNKTVSKPDEELQQETDECDCNCSHHCKLNNRAASGLDSKADEFLRLNT